MLGLGLASVGCDANPELAPITLDVTNVKATVDYSKLAKVLNRVVNKDGQVDTFRMNGVNKKYSQLLKDQLKLLAVTGPNATPELFSTLEQRVAYWYNARAAWAIELGMMQVKADAGKPTRQRDTDGENEPVAEFGFAHISSWSFPVTVGSRTRSV